MSPLPDATAIRRVLPHQGAMCVLDAVLDWDTRTITCRATGHRDPAHPMRGPHGLGSACGVEYAAQAMALHAALAAGAFDSLAGPPARLPAGRLASVRDLQCRVARLDDVPGDLQVSATLLSGDTASAMYAFEVGSGGQALLSGRASVLIMPPPAHSQPEHR